MPGKLTNQLGLPKTVQVWALKVHCPRKLLGSGQTEKATHPTAGCHRACHGVDSSLYLPATVPVRGQ